MGRTVAILAAAFIAPAVYAAGFFAEQTTGGKTAGATPIDRHALVSRHDIVVHAADPMGAMAVGNGEFAFNFDVTGAQSFPE